MVPGNLLLFGAMNPRDCILFSGGAAGAEAEFGACAERHGVEEVNFTFDGHRDARSRGIRVLTHEELEHGDLPPYDILRKLMQTFGLDEMARQRFAKQIEREKSGKGQWVQTSLLQAQVFMLDFQASRYLMKGEVAGQAEAVPAPGEPGRNRASLDRPHLAGFRLRRHSSSFEFRGRPSH